MNIAKVVRGLPRPLRRHRFVRGLLRLSPGSSVQEVTFNGGARLFADISDAFPRAYMLSGVFEPEFFDIVVPFLRRGGAFLDVGANVGFCSFGLVRALAGGPPVEFHLFEANPRLCTLIRRSIALHPDQSMEVVHGCVTDMPGTSRLHVVHEQLGSSYISDDGVETVPNVVLDEYLDSRGIARVPLMKMDIEWLEPRALAGARRSLSTGRIGAVYLEVSASNLARQGFTPATVLSALRDVGLEVFFVRRADLRACGTTGPPIALEIDGTTIPARRADAFPPGHQTDVLAVHPSVAAVRTVGEP
jgi:FkbM family methyltransferase